MKKPKIFLIHAVRIRAWFAGQLQELKALLVENNFELIPAVEDVDPKTCALIKATSLPRKMSIEEIHASDDSICKALSAKIKALEKEHILQLHRAINMADILIAVVTVPEIGVGMQIMYAEKKPILIVSDFHRVGAMPRTTYVRSFGQVNKRYQFEYYTSLSECLVWANEIREKYFAHLPRTKEKKNRKKVFTVTAE